MKSEKCASRFSLMNYVLCRSVSLLGVTIQKNRANI